MDAYHDHPLAFQVPTEAALRCPSSRGQANLGSELMANVDDVVAIVDEAFRLHWLLPPPDLPYPKMP